MTANPRRELALAALLAAAGAGLTLFAAGRVWATVRASGGITRVSEPLTGRELDAVPAGLALAGLAGLAALLAVRGRARLLVGALHVLCGAAVGYTSAAATGRAHALAVAAENSTMLRLGGPATVDQNGWWAASLAGGVLLLAAGALTLVRGARWPGMSARYDRGSRPAAAGTAADDPAALWKSLDRGEDPTVS